MGPESTAQSATRKACISCGKEFAGDITVCPEDGNVLTPLAGEKLVGTVLADRYEILEVAGGGGMGMVYKGRHKLMKRVVAIKMLHPQTAGSAAALKRFQKEAEAASALNHPNILTVFDFGLTNDGQPYLVMDYLEGASLADLLGSSDHLPAQRALKIFVQACAALDHAHKKGVIHRDLKPGNIMLIEADDQPDFVKIVDFGIAKLAPKAGETDKLTATGEVFGSPLYMSPEQCRGQDLDGRSDIYSLGCVMYRTLTGNAPVCGQDLPETMYKQVYETPLPFSSACPDLALPDQLEAIVFKAMAKQPEQRYQSMDELKGALEAVLSGGLASRAPAAAAAQPPAASAAPAGPGSRPAAQDATTAPPSDTPTTPMAGQTAEATPAAPGATTAPPTRTPTTPMGEQATAKESTAVSSQVDSTSGHKGQDKPEVAIAGTAPASTAQAPPLPAPSVEAQAPADPSAAEVAVPSPPATPDSTTLTAAPRAPTARRKLPPIKRHHIVIGGAAIAMLVAVFALTAVPSRYHVRLSPEDSAFLNLSTNAQNAFDKGNYAEAELSIRRAVQIAVKRYGNRDAHVGQALSLLGQIHYAQGHYSQAEADFQRALEIIKATAGPDSAQTATALAALGRTFSALGDYPEAEPILQESLSIRKSLSGPEHVDVADSLSGLADIAMRRHRYDEAIKLLSQALSIREKALSPDDPAVATSLNDLGQAYQLSGNYRQAEVLYKRALAVREQALGEDSPVVANSLVCLGTLYAQTGKTKQAQDLFKRALNIQTQALGPNSPSVQQTQKLYDALTKKSKRSSGNVQNRLR